MIDISADDAVTRRDVLVLPFVLPLLRIRGMCICCNCKLSCSILARHRNVTSRYYINTDPCMAACARSTVRIHVTRVGAAGPNQNCPSPVPVPPRESVFHGFGSSVRAELCLPLHAMRTPFVSSSCAHRKPAPAGRVAVVRLGTGRAFERASSLW